MKTAAIIAEYNPFHSGHMYQIDLLRRQGADRIIVIMSPDFVQRGEPAVAQERVRCRMALTCGADLVIALPVCIATGSAQYFAEGAVRILNSLGCVDLLSFGCETPDEPLLTRAARILADEPAEYKAQLKDLTASGLGYPAARAEALRSFFPGQDGEQISFVLSGANNILAIEYMRALLLTDSRMQPFPVQREGASYHDQSLDSGKAHLSASAIRSFLHAHPHPDDPEWAEMLTGRIPSPALEIFKSHIKNTGLPDDSVYRALLLDKLLRTDDFSSYLDITEEQANRLRNLLQGKIPGASLSDPVSALCTKQYTRSRCRRMLTHILLDITQDDIRFQDRCGALSYARVIGFQSDAADLMHTIASRSLIPLITKNASAEKLLPPDGLHAFRQDLRSDAVYHLLFPHHPSVIDDNPYKRTPLIL